VGERKNSTIRAERFIRNLRGGSQPILVEGTDGLLYVAKFLDNLQGPNVLFNEAFGAELFKACGISVPPWRPIAVSDDFLDRNRSCWFETPEGRKRPDSGLCFGSEFLGGPSTRLWEILPQSRFPLICNRKSFWLAWFLDVCCKHSDNRQAIFREDARGSLEAFFVDSGHLLGGATGSDQRCLGGSRYLDKRIYPELSPGDVSSLQRTIQALDLGRLQRQISKTPEEWKSAAAERAVACALDRLANKELGLTIWATISNPHPRRLRDQNEIPGLDKPTRCAICCT
jgi:hypothetical protein